MYRQILKTYSKDYLKVKENVIFGPFLRQLFILFFLQKYAFYGHLSATWFIWRFIWFCNGKCFQMDILNRPGTFSYLSEDKLLSFVLILDSSFTKGGNTVGLILMVRGPKPLMNWEDN